MTTTASRVPTRTTRNTTLGQEFAGFRHHAQPRIEAAVLASALVARLIVGSWAGGDALVFGALIGVQPFFEWVFHVYVLHYRPVIVFGRTIDFELARKHREHHVDPTVVALVFVPVRSLVVAIALSTALWLALMPSVATALTGVAGGAALLLAYEWTHYLIHSQHRPKTRVFRAVWRAHRLHHFKNEEYWFGVTSPAADYVLGTYPPPATVPTSPTARDLAAR
jgi:sterol desaturase/sphingolipid hydroxylase (fatty acid hydroxylase superfamily)